MEEFDFPTIVGDGGMGKKGGEVPTPSAGAGEATT
jgi:hypothetical protein